jgi:glycosyltransferase involved in cell wall biosynthesis
MTPKNTPRLALDMYVLAQSVRTGVYRVCDELFPRIARSLRFDTCFLVRPSDEAEAGAYLEAKGLSGRCLATGAAPHVDADVLLSPFGVAPSAWLDDGCVLHAHIIYDLIAVHHPEYFSEEASAEVKSIIASLDEHTLILAISEHTKSELLAYRSDLSPGQITVIPLAASDKFTHCENSSTLASMREKYGIPQNVPYVLSLATLEVRKNLDQVVRAFVRHLEEEEGRETYLVLAGMSGWKLEKLEEALVATGRWRHRIVVTGFVDDVDLSAIYSDALCFVYLSLYEGFGLPPLEAMACGTPVIVANNSSLPEVVADAGLLLEADDVQGVARAIQRFIESPSTRAEMVSKGLDRALLFNWDLCAEIAMEALSAGAERWSRRPAQTKRRGSRLPAAPDELMSMNMDSLRQASFLGYGNGSRGPKFSVLGSFASRGASGAWPAWGDRLMITAGHERVEGGLRTQGKLKSGTAALPLVSYITVVRNNTQTLARTIESVQQQTYGNVEHIVLDGASTDGTLDLIRKYSERLDYFISEADAGLYDAVNKAIPLARGQLICVLNSDDWLEPHAAEIAVRRMLRMLDGPALLLSAALVRDVELIHEWHPAFVHPGSYFICANDCHNAIYATRSAYELSGPYDTSYKIAADFKWIMTCLESDSAFIYTKEPTVNYSMGGTSSDVRQHSVECMRVVSERFEFLSSVEVSGLYHSFFSLAGALASQQGDQPENHTLFLRKVFAAHDSRPDFLRALSWASMATLEHPADALRPSVDTSPVAAGSSLKESLKERARGMLYRHPRLYRAAARSYRWFKG